MSSTKSSGGERTAGRRSAASSVPESALSGCASAASTRRTARTAAASDGSAGCARSLTEQLQVEQHLSERQLADLLRRPAEALRQQVGGTRQRRVDRRGELLDAGRDPADLVD